MVNPLISPSSIPPILRDPSLLVPSSLQAFSYQAWVPFLVLLSPSVSFTSVFVTLILPVPSLVWSLTTFLSKLLFSVLSRGLRLLSTLFRLLLISFLSHIPHTAVQDHHHPQAQWLTPPLSGSRQPCS